MIETTKLTPANTKKSLRTTIPMSVVKMFGLTEADHIEWNIDVAGKGVRITVKKGV